MLPGLADLAAQHGHAGGIDLLDGVVTAVAYQVEELVERRLNRRLSTRLPGSSNPPSIPRSAFALTNHAAYIFTNGMECKKEAAMAKLFGTQRSTEAAMDALQIHGGYAFMEDFKVNRFYREAKILELGEGTNEIQQIYIARELGC
jgi:alkylation response protein AidB-like acyl-CoA dehydrogenase